MARSISQLKKLKKLREITKTPKSEEDKKLEKLIKYGVIYSADEDMNSSHAEGSIENV